MDSKAHWEGVYSDKAVDEVGWFKPHFDVSLSLIAEASASPSARVIDIGGGASLLVDSLLDRGYDHVAVLDIAAAALEHAKRRLGEKADLVQWLVADVTELKSLDRFDIWHDRAVFHFLVNAADRQKYAALVKQTIPIGGHVIISTFSPTGPEQCSGLDIRRYSSDSLTAELGDGFRLIKEVPEVHVTPRGKSQSFMYAMLLRV